MKQIVGVVGPIASGKGVVISFFQNRGYDVISLSDIVRERAKEWGLPITRENLQNVGDSLRKKFGSSILAEMVAPIIKKNPKKQFIIDGIRNPAEIAFLQKEFDAYIIGVTATAKKRFDHMLHRGKDYDPTTWDEFEKAEKRDRGIGQEDYGQQVEKCLTRADIVLENNGTKEELAEKLQQIFMSF